MNTTIAISPRRSFWLSVRAVVGGWFAAAALSLAADAAGIKLGFFPPFDKGELLTTQMAAVMTAYRTVFNVGGCYLAARLAPRQNVGHALTLGVIGLAVSLAGALATAVAGPGWYPWALVILALPSAWVGGKIWQMRAVAAAMSTD